MQEWNGNIKKKYHLELTTRLCVIENEASESRWRVNERDFVVELKRTIYVMCDDKTCKLTTKKQQDMNILYALEVINVSQQNFICYWYWLYKLNAYHDPPFLLNALIFSP